MYLLAWDTYRRYDEKLIVIAFIHLDGRMFNRRLSSYQQNEQLINAGNGGSNLIVIVWKIIGHLS